MPKYDDDPYLSDSSRRVLRRVMERRQQQEKPQQRPSSSPHRSSARRAPSESGDDINPRPRNTTPTRSRKDGSSSQHASTSRRPSGTSEDEKQRYREEMRRNLDHLREEVYRGRSFSRDQAMDNAVPVRRDEPSPQGRSVGQQRPQDQLDGPAHDTTSAPSSHRPARRQLSPPRESSLSNNAVPLPETSMHSVASREAPPNSTSYERFEHRMQQQDQHIRRLVEEVATLRNELRETRDAHRDELARQRAAAEEGKHEAIARLSQDMKEIHRDMRSIQDTVDALNDDVRSIDNKGAGKGDEGGPSVALLSREVDDNAEEIGRLRRSADTVAGEVQRMRGELRDLSDDFMQIKGLKRDITSLRKETEHLHGELNMTRRQTGREIRQHAGTRTPPRGSHNDPRGASPNRFTSPSQSNTQPRRDDNRPASDYYNDRRAPPPSHVQPRGDYRDDYRPPGPERNPWEHSGGGGGGTAASPRHQADMAVTENLVTRALRNPTPTGGYYRSGNYSRSSSYDSGDRYHR